MSKEYTLRLVGEQHYEAACAAAAVGDRVLILRETHNPYDSKAIVAKNDAGDTLGYVPRESFVQDVIHEQGRGISAEIREKLWENGHWQIVLSVVVRAKPADVVRYKATAEERAQFQELRDQAKASRPAARRPPAPVRPPTLPPRPTKQADEDHGSPQRRPDAAVLLLFAALVAIVVAVIW